MFKYSENWEQFIKDIQLTEIVKKDQWQLQMQIRALEKIGRENLYFINDVLSESELLKLNVNPVVFNKRNISEDLQNLLNELIKENSSYCSFFRRSVLCSCKKITRKLI